ncbi:MAG: type VI secretion system baseplate subunit TssF [Planctomycetota bacterium]
MSSRRSGLHQLYEQELAFLQQEAFEFAQRHGERVSGLLIERHQCNDPHVERLIEACALLTARIRLRLNDGFGDIADAMLDVLQPNSLAPIPPMTIVQFLLEPGHGQVEGGVYVQRHVGAATRARVQGFPLRFRTCYDTRLFPIEVAEIELTPASSRSLGLDDLAGVEAALRIVLRSNDELPLAELGMRELRFFLDGDFAVTQPLYELFFRHGVGLATRRDAQSEAALLSPLPEHPLGIVPVGFAADETLLDDHDNSSSGYRILQEYFAYPDKFLFVTLTGLERAPIEGTDDTVELLVLLDHLPAELADRIRFKSDPSRPDKRAVLQLGCTPAVNLFRHPAEPIRLTHRTDEYAVIPEARARDLFEVHRIEEVRASVIGSGESRPYRPFYALRHGDASTDEVGFWHARRQSFADAGTDVFVTLVDRKFDPVRPEGVEVVHIVATCSNRDALRDAVFRGDTSDLQVEGQPEIAGAAVLRQPSASSRAAFQTPVDARGGAADDAPSSESRWRLISHLNLNHLSLAPGCLDSKGAEAQDRAGKAALEALRDILRLNDPLHSRSSAQQIEGVTGLRTVHVTRVIPGVGAVRGLRTEVDLDPTKFPGNSPFLFASILDRFFSLYCSLNSFTETAARLKTGEYLMQWQPRTGERTLI